MYTTEFHSFVFLLILLLPNLAIRYSLQSPLYCIGLLSLFAWNHFHQLSRAWGMTRGQDRIFTQVIGWLMNEDIISLVSHAETLPSHYLLCTYPCGTVIVLPPSPLNTAPTWTQLWSFTEIDPKHLDSRTQISFLCLLHVLLN